MHRHVATLPSPVHAVGLALTVFLAGLASHCSAADPILVLTDSTSENPFGNYVGEILRGEGLNAFTALDRQSWNTLPDLIQPLAEHRAVYLAEMHLTAAEQQALRQYVHSGGVLLASRPDAGLADLFGIQFAGNRPERPLQYFAAAPRATSAAQAPPYPLQYHGVASNYDLAGAEGLAYLYATEDQPTAHPAITTHTYGAGRAIAFSFDPAKSVVLTRQGNPAWQNTEGDGIPEYRPHDMFVRTDGRSWYDPSRVGIPQADELQRLVAKVVQDSVEAPLPRMWYLPETHKSLMVNTGDGEDDYGPFIDPVLNDAASYGGKFSVYLRDIGVANTTVQKEAQWRAAGHEVGVHMYADGAEGAGAIPQMTHAYGRVTNSLQNKFGHGARTARNHTIDWTGWVDMARIEAEHGTLLDTNYYHYLNGAVVDPLTANGYFTGSGLPQQMIDEQGSLLGVYQAATQWPDEWFANNGMSAQQAVDIMKAMFEAAEANGYYSAFVNNIHPVRYNGADITSDWAHAIWQYCRDEGIPMWSAEMLLDFVQARHATQFTELAYSADGLEFDYTAGGNRLDLTVMIPTAWGQRRLTELTVEGSPVEWATEIIKGVEYALFTPTVTSARIAAQYAQPPSADFDGDGDVDAFDLALWRAEFGMGAAGDADLDGDSDGLDFLQWQRQFDSTRMLHAAAQVPEPRLFEMLLSLAAAALGRAPLTGPRQRRACGQLHYV